MANHPWWITGLGEKKRGTSNMSFSQHWSHWSTIYYIGSNIFKHILKSEDVIWCHWSIAVPARFKHIQTYIEKWRCHMMSLEYCSTSKVQTYSNIYWKVKMSYDVTGVLQYQQGSNIFKHIQRFILKSEDVIWCHWSIAVPARFKHSNIFKDIEKWRFFIWKKNKLTNPFPLMSTWINKP